MNKKSDLAIATVLHETIGDIEYNIDSTLLLKKLCEEHNMPLVIGINQGASSKFKEKLTGLDLNIYEASQAGIAGQHKTVFQNAALVSNAIIYTEPDKREWFKEGLENTITQYIPNNFSLIARTAENFQTFPDAQQKYEQKLNDTLSKYTNIKGDYIYGPRIVPSSLVNTLQEIPPNTNYGWGTLTHLLVRAVEQQIPIQLIGTGSACPKSQRTELNESYRKKQYEEHLYAFNFANNKNNTKNLSLESNK